ncbi:hypothetical protein [Thermaurantiacus sp.]
MDGLTPREDRLSGARPAGGPRPARSARFLPGLLVGLVAGGGVAALLAPPALRLLGDPPEAGVPQAPPPDPALARLEERIRTLEAERAAIAAPAEVAPPPSPPAPQELAGLEAETRRLGEALAALDARFSALVADLEGRGETAGALAEATGRVRELYFLLAVRRHLERGMPLGALEPALVRAFEGREPSAVAAIVAWSRSPVSVRQLETRLADPHAGPMPDATAPGGFWSRLWTGLSGLVELRRSAGPEAEARKRARAALAGEDLATAIALIDSGSRTGFEAAWLEDARRLLAARDGLERLELLALAEPPSAAGPLGTRRAAR